MNTPVVITGIGWVTPLGFTIDGVWQRMLAGESGVGPIRSFDASTMPTTFAAQVPTDFDYREHVIDPDRHGAIGPNSAKALAAATMAWRNALLDHTPNLDRDRVGIYTACSEGENDITEVFDASMRSWDADRAAINENIWIQTMQEALDAAFVREREPVMALKHLAMAFDIGGPAYNCITACAAGTQAIGEAADLIRRNDADVILTGGAHSTVNFLALTGFGRLTALSTHNEDPASASRPFSADRDGFVLGDAAAMLILESADHAKRRNAPILAELAGQGSSADAYRVTDMPADGSGAISAMTAALADADMSPEEIDYISAHGTATQDNDSIETAAIKTVFKDHARKLTVSSIKSMVGHSVAAAGAVEAVTCILAIRDQMVPPTINLHHPDPACDLNYVPHRGRRARVDACLSNSFGFGGQNQSIIIRRFATKREET